MGRYCDDELCILHVSSGPKPEEVVLTTLLGHVGKARASSRVPAFYIANEKFSSPWLIIHVHMVVSNVKTHPHKHIHTYTYIQF